MMVRAKKNNLYTDKVIQAHNLEVSWSPEVTFEIEELVRSSGENIQEQGLDLTSLPFVTVDGVDARDYDDAIFAGKIDGGWLLRIAIADVSHYVRPGTALDKACKLRGNSTYFVDRVIPMLPDPLCNDLCSLRPGEDRLAIVCNIYVANSGEILEWTFDKALIRSQFRLTYAEVDQYLGKKEERFHRLWGKAVCESLDMASQVVQVRRSLFTGKGRIDIRSPETEITLGNYGAVVAVNFRESNAATQLVEECMLSANFCAAETLEKTLGSALYRTHQPPSSQDLLAFREVLQRFGLTLAGGVSPTIQDFNQILREAREVLGQGRWFEGLVLRTLKKACYDSTPAPHFALGVDCYTHFTSPIRRYPDLVVHRLIKSSFGYDRSIQIDSMNDQLAEVGVHCSMTERRAESAERAVIACYKAEFMLGKIGQVFKGCISGVTEFGVFVQLLDQPIDGLVHVSQLESDYYKFNPQGTELLGKHTGKTYRLGDPIDVILTGASPEEGQISFSSTRINQSISGERFYRRNKMARRGR